MATTATAPRARIKICPVTYIMQIILLTTVCPAMQCGRARPGAGDDDDDENWITIIMINYLITVYI